MKIIKTLLPLFLICAVMLSACAGKQTPPADTASSTDAATPAQTLQTGIESVNKYGNIILTATPDEMRALGFVPADVILVQIGEKQLQMPIGTAYSDVDSGEPVCRFKTDDEDGDQVVLAVNAGNMASTLGIAEINRIEEDPGYECLWADGFGADSKVSISMVTPQGYAEGYRMHQLAATRTDNREDYADLNDAQYANFRAVITSGMGAGALYRSSSPIDPDLNRNQEADAAVAECGIRTVVNMTDSQETMLAYPGYAESNYAKCDVIALNMEMDFFTDAFKEKLAEGFRFMASHEGPYLIHCKEGKDRTGFAAGILECLMGASADEAVADYMLTYRNFYGVASGDDQYAFIADSNIKASLCKAFGIEALDGENIDLAQCAQTYLQSIGLTDAEISALKDHLSKAYR